MIFTTPPALANLVAPWASYYSDSKTAATIVVFLHVAPLIVGGGLAIATDRATLRATEDDSAGRFARLAGQAAAHRTVIGSLVLSAVSGVALLAADLDTFLGSWVFWLKMGLVALLLGNGALMKSVEHGIATAGVGAPRAWKQLRLIAMVSIALWLITTFVGVALTNAA